MTEKDKRIIECAEKENIPIFVLTAKDKFVLNAIIAYRDGCADSCSVEHYQAIEERINEFISWQGKNVDKVKIPD